MHGRSPAIELGRSRIGTHQILLVARLELVSVAGEGFKIRDSIVTRAGGEDVVEDQSAEGCVSARTSSADGHPLSIDVTPVFKIPRGVDTVLDVYDSPLASQPLTICASIS